jgi:hypothetical protein
VTDGPDWVTLPLDYPSALDGLIEGRDAGNEHGGAYTREQGEHAYIVDETPPPHYFPPLPETSNFQDA